MYHVHIKTISHYTLLFHIQIPNISWCVTKFITVNLDIIFGSRHTEFLLFRVQLIWNFSWDDIKISKVRVIIVRCKVSGVWLFSKGYVSSLSLCLALQLTHSYTQIYYTTYSDWLTEWNWKIPWNGNECWKSRVIRVSM